MEAFITEFLNNVNLATLGKLNLGVFLFYLVDKLLSKIPLIGRISELALLITSAAFGALGALAGMLLWRHKTQHLIFKVGVPVLLVFQIIVLAQHRGILPGNLLKAIFG